MTYRPLVSVQLGDIVAPGDDGPCHGMPGRVVRIYEVNGVPTADISYGMVAQVPIGMLYSPEACPPPKDFE